MRGRLRARARQVGGVRCHLALSFPGKNLLFLLTLAILMVPYATLLIPLC
ncbi:hypothetical protein OG806_42040 [Streptomyces sp. NBC_00882]|nr:hypothetical protein OG806_42040 [Streptomyces sp. NBC_00882]WSZ62465.1 hypothetical protein OH824_40965 [Streptomyces canus]